jgi:Sec-independent protein translocase protein TatA
MISSALVAMVLIFIIAAITTDLPELARKTGRAARSLTPSERKRLRNQRSHERTLRLEREHEVAPTGIETTIAELDERLGNSNGKDIS